ncbi:hypothetical protein CK203_029220 [Vitis vinifera]|uniref:Uncharacterized protein n=1 Tax=Vitis vinifera TaxID=29760 RepID=A0A438IT00_VITVI|nr:hypothetical protein CK203_029220 [Vitis vinifera]
MEAVLPVEIEMGSLRIALEQQIPETDWAQAQILEGSSDPVGADLIHQGVYSRGRCMADGFRWKPALRANQCGSAKEFDLFHLSPHRHYVHIRHHWVPGSWDLLYLLHFIHEGMDFDHRVFELSFLRFNHLITLAYVTSRVLRPPKAMGSDIVFYGFYEDSGAYREPSSQARAFRCLDVAMLPSERRLFDMWELLLSRSTRFLLFDIVVVLDEVMSSAWIPTSSFQCGTHQPWRRSFSHMFRRSFHHSAGYIVFASLTIIPELFIDMSPQWNIVQDS